MKEQKVDLKAIAFTTGPELEDFRNSLGTDANNVFGVSWWMPQMKYSDPLFGTSSDYAAAYDAKYEEEIAYQAAGASQGGLLLQMAIEKAGSLDTDKVREALRSYEGTTFWGPTKWDETGQNIAGSTVTFQIQNMKIETVFPAAAATASPVYPY
jgi:branched-chain amino acid transport system substrate-binding protein